MWHSSQFSLINEYKYKEVRSIILVQRSRTSQGDCCEIGAAGSRVPLFQALRGSLGCEPEQQLIHIKILTWPKLLITVSDAIDLSMWNGFWVVAERDFFHNSTLSQDWWNMMNRPSHLFTPITSVFWFFIFCAMWKNFEVSVLDNGMALLAGTLPAKWDGVFNVIQCWFHLETW